MTFARFYCISIDERNQELRQISQENCKKENGELFAFSDVLALYSRFGAKRGRSRVHEGSLLGVKAGNRLKDSPGNQVAHYSTGLRKGECFRCRNGISKPQMRFPLRQSRKGLRLSLVSIAICPHMLVAAPTDS